MKKITAYFVLALSLLSAPGFASQKDSKDLANNYQACMQSDESWYRRWGAYLVSFDMNEAYRICRSYYQNADVDRIGCYLDGHWKNAGYICDFEH